MAEIQNDDNTRRQYWTESMESAVDFINRVCASRVEECMEGLASLRIAAEEGGAEVEFSAKKLGGRFDRIFYLRKGLIVNFLAVAKEMNERGWILKVEDGYRTVPMQKSLAVDEKIFESILRKVIWEHEGERPPADTLYRRVSALVATRPAHGTHMSASALDISVLNRADGSEVWRGGPYIEMSELTPMESPFVQPAEAANRRAITDIMVRHGFLAYPYEFWHYSAGDAVAAVIAGSHEPVHYGPIDWDADSGAIRPIERMQPLVDEETLRDRMMSMIDKII